MRDTYYVEKATPHGVTIWLVKTNERLVRRCDSFLEAGDWQQMLNEAYDRGLADGLANKDMED